MVNRQRTKIFSYLKSNPEADNTAKSLAIALNLTVSQVRYQLDNLCYLDIAYFERKKLPDRHGIHRVNLVYKLKNFR